MRKISQSEAEQLVKSGQLPKEVYEKAFPAPPSQPAAKEQPTPPPPPSAPPPGERDVQVPINPSFGDLSMRRDLAKRIRHHDGAHGLDSGQGGGQDVDSGPVVQGTRTLYKGIFLREYDETGSLIAAGSETGTTEDDIAEGHTLQETWDYPRVHP